MRDEDAKRTFLACSCLNLLRTHEGISVGDVVALKDPNVEGQPYFSLSEGRVG